MLRSLAIRNYALIVKLEIDFSSGFTVITGETGAGKSILLGALALLLGKRADSGVLASREEKCIVEGVFNIENLKIQQLFKQYDLDYDDETVIRREILPSGRSRAFVNDTPVSLQVLKDFGARLVDVHSQHETLLLGDSNFQMTVLDNYIGMGSLLSKYSDVYQNYSKAYRKLEQLTKEIEKAKRDHDYFQYLFDELEAGKLDVNEFQELKTKEKFYTHAEEVIHGISRSNRILNEDDENISGMIGEVSILLSGISDYLEEADSLLSRIKSVKIEIDDLASELSSLNESVDFNPDELERVNRRLDTIYSLQQKHHVSSVQELVDLKNGFEEKLSLISTGEEDLTALQNIVDHANKELITLSKSLTDKRKQHSDEFSKVLKETLTELGMKDAGFQVNIETLNEFTIRGLDRVSFAFNANRGGALQPIDKIASGGELSRLMLAIKSLITREKILPTVIFDEIDAGVSGDIAGKVGNIMKKMANHHQVIAISHLPQIAAKADHHFKVYKKEGDETTFTMIRRLDDEDRVDEIAKLMSDEKVSDSAIKTARELLSK